MGNNKFIAKVVAAGAVVGTAVVAAVSPDMLESVVKNLSDASQTEFAKNCTMFALAAWIHSGRLKKEVRSNFASLSLSIDKVAEAFHADLESHKKILDNLAGRVASLEAKQPQTQKENQS